jgi:curved DNA-binding protein CbpA
MTVNDCFRILELPRNAGLDDLKFAYRAKAKEFHPDHKGGDSRKFTRLHEAYTLLLDYDPIKNPRKAREQDSTVKKEAERTYDEERKRRKARREMERKAAEVKARYERREKDRQEALRKSRKAAEEKRREKSPVHQARIFGDILSGTKPVREKMKAIDNLVSLKRKSVYPYLKKGFYSNSEKVITAAIEAVGKLRIVQAGPELASLMCSGSPQIRMAVLKAVSEFEKPAVFRDIIDMGFADREKAIVRQSEILRSRLNG